MSFCIDLTEEVKRRISAWKLSSRLIRDILENLYEELAEKPTQHLVRVREPGDILLYSCTVRAEGDPTVDYIFEFAVKYYVDEETLVIHDCDFVTVEPGPV
jgi:hypothetical protein